MELHRFVTMDAHHKSPDRRSLPRLLWLVFAATLSTSSLAQTAAIKAALECKPAKTCPKFGEVFRQNAEIQSMLVTELNNAGIEVPFWLYSGVEAPVAAVKLGGKTYIAGRIVQRQGSDNTMTVLFDVRGKRVAGRVHMRNRVVVEFGHPSKEEDGLLNEREALAASEEGN